jgi:dienelactone hydrolase
MRMLIFLVSFLFLQAPELGAQAGFYDKPLKEVLKDIESRYQVKLSYSENLVKDKIVTHAFWRFREDAEATLGLVLGPFDLVFHKNDKGIFEISAFQYHRRPPEEGARHLERLLTQYPDLASWEKRREELKQCIQQQLNLSPWPEKNPLKPVFTPKRRHNGYTTENVALETLPGLYLSGTLYRPSSGRGPFPAVMIAQGHFELQRYGDEPQILAATLARMGAVVFSYDMFAMNESMLQFDMADHRTRAAQVIQTWNSIRVLDFLTSLKEVDSQRIAMTGASGGGTQTFLATVLDPRIAVSVPVVMVSSWFYGGCTCESGMPIHTCGKHGTNNAEIAAMAAPRPMLVVSIGNDWTVNVPENEYPYIRKIYEKYGRENLVQNVHLPDERHDYGPSKRAAVCKFLAGHLSLSLNAVLGPDGRIDETPCTIETADEMKVFGTDGEKLPQHAIRGLNVLRKKYSFLPE